MISLVLSLSCWSGGAVIIHPSNPDNLQKADINQIFLGKRKSFPTGGDAIPVDLQEYSILREEFIKEVLRKNNQQLKSYWAQKLFSGKGTPPIQVEREEQIKKLVASNPALIGYIDTRLVDESVKVVYEF
ncbi:MAG: phosphate ABC transporter substrate-binding protein [Gammaproteobacteria bacterium]|nr:phosphate ABC transporter substrate-binding protein [Pseudomaricurvus alcaniphilus]MBR9912365.1 phosphate ABC transporter substrate-binding protein [Gammaproteobacteria bacterium]NHN35814.1 phosphate ABC transporter substrate-binding protein [Pseudomaricurvus alcaniphilus]